MSTAKRGSLALRKGALTVVETHPSSWAPVDLAAVIAGIESGEFTGPTPSILTRSDGRSLLYRGEVHSLSGEPETGKGWVALTAAAEVLHRGGRVLYLDFEDGPHSVISRLLAVGVGAEALVALFSYVRPSETLTDDDLAELLGDDELVVLDGLTEAYDLLGLDPYLPSGVTEFERRLPRLFAAAGAAVLEIDHVTKDRDSRGRYAFGSQHKLAGVAAAFQSEAAPPPNRHRPGLIKLKLTKDRHGHIGNRGSVIALVAVVPSDGGACVQVTVNPPDGLTDTGAFRPTELMARITDILGGHNRGLSKRGLRERVKGNSAAADKALGLLVEEGYVRFAPVGNRHTYTLIRAFEKGADHG